MTNATQVTKAKKMSIEIACNMLADRLRDKHTSFKFYRISDDAAPVPILIDGNNNCQMLSDEQACAYLSEISRKLGQECFSSIGEYGYPFSNVDILFLTHASARAALKTLGLRSFLRVSGRIKPFAFLSDDCMTFCRIPFDPSPQVYDTPNFDKFFENFTNTDAIKIWIGSLFVNDSDRSQYLWMYGKGGNGKSTFARVLSKVFGQFVKYEQAPKNDDKYWTNGLIGKRLIVIDDCNNYGFVKTGLFKSLTGSSRVRVEQKYGNPYDTDLDCKFMFTSNELPMISEDESDQRRIIFSSAKNKKSFKFDKNFEKRLELEMSCFISNCVGLYNKHCSDGQPVPTCDLEAKDLASIHDEQVESFMERFFDISETSLVPVSEFRGYVDASKINPRHVYDYLERNGIQRAVANLNGRSTKVLKGIRTKVVTGRF